MPRHVEILLASAFVLFSAQAASPADIITSVTREQVAAVLKDHGYRAELVANPSSSTGPFIRTGIEGHNVVVLFFNCAAEKCAAIQFWSGFKKSPKFTPALVKQWNTDIRYAKTHLTDDGGIHMEYDIYLRGGVSTEYINSAIALYGNLLARLDQMIKETPAATTETTSKGGTVEALVAQGKFTEAISALDETASALWEKAPLTFRRALWVAATPDGYGAYNPRESNVFATGVPMIAYVEPVGFGWRKNGDLFVTDLAIDLAVKGKDGSVLLRKEDFQGLRIASRVKNREFMTHMTLTFTGIPAGEYIAETTMRDKVSGKSGTFALPFTVR